MFRIPPVFCLAFFQDPNSSPGSKACYWQMLESTHRNNKRLYREKRKRKSRVYPAPPMIQTVARLQFQVQKIFLFLLYSRECNRTPVYDQCVCSYVDVYIHTLCKCIHMHTSVCKLTISTILIKEKTFYIENKGWNALGQNLWVLNVCTYKIQNHYRKCYTSYTNAVISLSVNNRQ